MMERLSEVDKTCGMFFVPVKSAKQVVDKITFRPALGTVRVPRKTSSSSRASRITFCGLAQNPCCCHEAHPLHTYRKSISTQLPPSLPLSPPSPPPPLSFLVAGCFFLCGCVCQTSVIQTAMSTVAKTLVTFPKEATIVKVCPVHAHTYTRLFAPGNPHRVYLARVYPSCSAAREGKHEPSMLAACGAPWLPGSAWRAWARWCSAFLLHPSGIRDFSSMNDRFSVAVCEPCSFSTPVYQSSA